MASLLSPCDLETSVNGKKIYIKEETGYPYQFTVKFIVDAENATFGLKIRIPAWAKKFSVNEKYKQENGFIVIRKKWNGRQTIQLEFFPEVKTGQDINKRILFFLWTIGIGAFDKSGGCFQQNIPVARFSPIFHINQRN